MNVLSDWRTIAGCRWVRCFLRQNRKAVQRRIGATHCFGLCSSEEGSQLVEFALVLPIMLMITMGIFVISIAMNNYLQLTEATSSAARAVSVARGNTLDPCSVVSSTVTQGAPTLSSSNLTYTLALNDKTGANLGTYGPTKGTFSCSGTSITSGPPSYLEQNGSATVTVTYPCNMTIFGTNYAPGGCTLQAQISEVVQ